MFDQLSSKILNGMKRLKGQGKLKESDIEDALKEIRLALLEADVHFKVVKQFTENVKLKAIGQNIIGSLRPDQQIVKIVHDELKELMGGQNAELIRGNGSPVVIMLVGLQGAGKTTTAGKLAFYLKEKQKKTVLLASTDVYRPAAMDQLKKLCEDNGLKNFPASPTENPVKIAKAALAQAQTAGYEYLILDTAGRLQIDEGLMTELEDIKNTCKAQNIILVADAMTGQDAVSVSQGFHEKINLTGAILTKLDGDARGGAALSIKAVTGVPLLFVGVSEKISGLELFHPDRMAGRILDMGDVLSLAEKAAEVFDQEKAAQVESKIRKNQFTLEDFRDQLRQIKKMGSLENIFKMLPGMGQLSQQLKNMTPPDEELKKIEAIINSMTPRERRAHQILNGSRRARIARGSGTQVSDINRFIKQFEQTQKMMQLLGKKGRGGLGGGFFG